MIPILFDSTATTFTTNGIGRLSDAISCTVHEARNGEFELEMVYPMDGAHYDDIVHSAIIVAKPSARRNQQAFRIYKITKPLDGRISVYAQHISYQLSFIPVSPFSASSLTNALKGFKNNAAEDCPFTLSADFTSTSSYAVPMPTSIRSYLGGRSGSILDVYGGEWEWDNYNCYLHSARGEDNGYVIEYGKNLTSLQQEESIANTYTGLYPYWESDGTVVTLTEKVVHASTASNFPFRRTIVKDFSDDFDNAPTEAQLRTYAKAYMKANDIGIPSVSLSIDYINLADTEEYKDLLSTTNIDLCDTVTVRFAKLGVDVQSKVVEITWDVLKDRYASIEVGNKRSSLADTIEDQAQTVSTLATTDDVTRTVDRATGVLNSGTRGHVILNRNADGYANEILILDNENVASAENVLRINNAGIGFSSTGYSGTYAQAWTLDGHLTLGGVGDAYGTLSILNASGDEIGRWNRSGLRLYDSSGNLLLNLAPSGLYLYDTSQNHLVELTTSGLIVNKGTVDIIGSDNGYVQVTNAAETQKATLSDGAVELVGTTGTATLTGDSLQIDLSGDADGAYINLTPTMFEVYTNVNQRVTITNGEIDANTVIADEVTVDGVELHSVFNNAYDGVVDFGDYTLTFENGILKEVT